MPCPSCKSGSKRFGPHVLHDVTASNLLANVRTTMRAETALRIRRLGAPDLARVQGNE
ncbi:MAG: hypothetical protein AAF727_01040 [Pseudomonadota bacterium]